MAKITSITLYDKDNFLWFDDSDIQTDYFNTVNANTKNTIYFVEKYGDIKITVKLANNATQYEQKELAKYDKRVSRIAKALNYNVSKKISVNYSHDYYNNHEPKFINVWFIVEWTLIKDKEAA